MKSVRRRRTDPASWGIPCGPEDCGYPDTDCRYGRCDPTCDDRGRHWHTPPRRVYIDPEVAQQDREVGLFRDTGDALHRCDNWLAIRVAFADGKTPPEPVFSEPMPGVNLFPK